MTLMNVIFSELPSEWSNNIYLVMVIALVFFSYILQQCARQVKTWDRVKEYAIYTVARKISPRYEEIGFDADIAAIVSIFLISVKQKLKKQTNHVLFDLFSLVAVDRIISWVSKSLVINSTSPNILLLFFYIIFLSCSRSLIWNS